MDANIRVMAFDLDGTLTQHKTPLAEPNIGFLNALSRHYTLLMVGAGQCKRIFRQMNGYPISIIGNYGMQFSKWNTVTGQSELVYDEHVSCDREATEKRIWQLRERYGYTRFSGDNVEYHDSGCITFPLLGTTANIEEKLAFDPDRSKRRLFYDEVCVLFPEYTVFVGGSSSFDLAPKPYNKYYALDRYCQENGLSHAQVVYAGDDYGKGGNDEAVYTSDFQFICVDDYRKFGEAIADFL